MSRTSNQKILPLLLLLNHYKNARYSTNYPHRYPAFFSVNAMCKCAMSLDDFIIPCFCWIDDTLPAVPEGKKIRPSSPQPNMSDSEVLAIEIVGRYLGPNQDQALVEFFRHHYGPFFPVLLKINRSTFVQQAASLWAIEERLWMLLRDQVIRHDKLIGIIDSMSVSSGVCAFAAWPALANIMRIGRPFTAFACICGWAGLESSRMPSWLQPMKPMGKSPQWCWKERRDLPWATAPIGCLTFRPLCARIGLSCKPGFAMHTRLRQQRTKVRCSDRCAIGLTQCSGKSRIATNSSASGHAMHT